MDYRTVKLLEFDQIIKILLEFCISEEGRQKLNSQELFFNSDKLIEFQTLVAELRMLLESDEIFPVSGFPEISHLIQICLKEGTSLPGLDIYNISQFIISALKVKSYICTSKISDLEDIIREVSKIPEINKLASEIIAVIDSTGQIREDHPELRKLRRGLGKLNNNISSLSASYMTDNKNLWQTDVPSQKNGRIVLPLKSNFKGRVKGIIHDISAKGTILYIEPFDILELNNEIAVQEHEISIIANRIFRELTGKIRLEISDLTLLIDSFSYIDTIFARAKFSMKYQCFRPEISKSEIFLDKARHLLLGKDAVPIDIKMEKDLRVLIITGPNAGGKTVSIKTVGLLAIMHQFGLQIPVGEGSVLPVFDGIFADIGDDQSIEDALSTFSGHMKNIASILNQCSNRTLVLLDELGSGTDPGEGAAIAMSVLDKLIEKGSTVLTTSHHGLLKNYGYTKEKVMNASMEFDENSHSSTYRIVPGVPGDSHAIDIARYSGLSEEIVEAADSYLKNKETEVGRMIRELERKHRSAGEREDAINLREKKLREQIREYDLKFLSLKQSENELIKKKNTESSKFLLNAGKTLENLVKELKEGELNKEKTGKVKKFLSDISKKIEQEKIGLNQFIVNNPNSINPELLQSGMEILVGEYRRSGTIVRKDKNRSWIINTGAIKISVKEHELFPAPPKKEQQSFGVSLNTVRASNLAKFTIDLRGFRLENALENIKYQIDNALMSGLQEFNIIHGKGEGVLSTGIHKYLKGEHSIKDFYFAHPDNGGFGKTIVVLKE